MPAERDTRLETARLRRLAPLQTVENQSRAWGLCCHSCTWRKGLAPLWNTELQGESSPRGLPGSQSFLSTNGSHLHQGGEVVWEGDTSPLAHEREGKATRLSISVTSRDACPLRHDRLLHRHGAIEIGDEPTGAQSRNDCIHRAPSTFDLVGHLGGDLHEGCHLEKRPLPARADDITGLGQYHQAPHGGFRQIDALVTHCGTRLGQRHGWVEPVDEPVLPQHTIPLAPRLKGCVNTVVWVIVPRHCHHVRSFATRGTRTLPTSVWTRSGSDPATSSG